MTFDSTSQATQTVHYYDFSLTYGHKLSVPVTPEAGDTIDFGTSQINIHLSEKPSPINPESKMPAEDITIYIHQVLAINRITAQVPVPSKKAAEEWRRTLAEVGGAVH